MTGRTGRRRDSREAAIGLLDTLRRRRLPKELRDALREAERADRRRRRAPRRRLALPRLRRLPMVVWFVLLAVLVVGVTTIMVEPESTTARGPAPPPQRLSGLARVIDGDTIAIGSERLRLEGIDAPEMSQSCTRGGRDYRCGDSARDALRRILGRGMVSCDALGRDVFNRQLVVCHGEDGRDLGAAMVAAGWAVAFTRYSDRYVAEKRSARAQRRGLWEGEFETPSDYRRRNR